MTMDIKNDAIKACYQGSFEFFNLYNVSNQQRIQFSIAKKK